MQLAGLQHPVIRRLSVGVVAAIALSAATAGGFNGNVNCAYCSANGTISPGSAGPMGCANGPGGLGQVGNEGRLYSVPDADVGPKCRTEDSANCTFTICCSTSPQETGYFACLTGVDLDDCSIFNYCTARCCPNFPVIVPESHVGCGAMSQFLACDAPEE